ncbi:oxygen-independent coproporphyrinogen III oxidase [Neolewinella aurantiaca]|uniref:Coproporphyrinogen-III oxidase n=1 Tax=Neolewinella aurantiaca TaxID=2602767 RepID=A0A5C7FLY7_9BACT|nr:oxygen-independent coproporphyrinogen III oxidase [Neolewinella aurantiaca]TXF91041.1 oxygen-independent coproporphyrinogen III oxidase [Neolewinella aurantiaca]
MTLINKYNKPVPRYTSYPTVPYWDVQAPVQDQWLGSLNTRLAETRDVSLYIHLPFCEELCTYCGCNKRITKRHEVEAPYIDAVLAEWAIYVRSLHLRPRLKELHLGGGTPTFFSPAELGRLIDGILKDADVADDHSFGFEAHPNSTTPEHLQSLADRGFNRVSIGVQDFNPEIMRLINRRQTAEEVERTVEAARKIGYKSINFDVIYGLPRQTQNDIVRSVVKIQEMRPERIAFYGYAHVPWVSPGQRAYDENDLPKGDKKWQLYATGRDLLESSGYEDIGLDHFSLPEDDLARAAANGRLHRNFMGYTTANTPVTLALGCSSIGDSWDTFVQNEKKVEAYTQAVIGEGRLPLVKGHKLSSEDQIVRRHILNLMCKGYTEWYAEEQRCEALGRAVEHWNDMAADGIITRSPYRVEVTAHGKPFLRNICLPLDDYYWARQPSAKTFSQSI